jgi:hypothetical protein
MTRILKLLVREMCSAAFNVLVEEAREHAPDWLIVNAVPVIRRWGHYEAPRA